MFVLAATIVAIMENTRLHILLDRFFSESYTAEEKAELMTLLDNSANDEAVKKYLEAAWGNVPLPHRLDEEQSANILNTILSRNENPVVSITATRSFKTWYRVAAAVLIIVVSATSFLFTKPLHRPVEPKYCHCYQHSPAERRHCTRHKRRHTYPR